MNSKDFFRFRSKLISANARVAAIELDLEPDPYALREADHTKLIKGKYAGINFPVIFKQEHRGKFNDLLDTGWPGLYLISEKLKIILEENHLTGWQVYPVKLYHTNDNELFGYHGFSIIGHCGPVSYTQSEIIEKREIPHGPIVKYCKGITFDRWDGSDFFIPEKTGYEFITNRTAEILKKNKVSNLSLTNLSEVETNIRYTVRE